MEVCTMKNNNPEKKTKPKNKGVGQELAEPPRDNPMLRHDELKLDRAFGSEDKKLAKLRLDAIEHASKMPKEDETGEAETEGGDGLTFQPVPGISNWVQMGPTAIPNGQTYGGARVMVTGRVTAIVVDPTNTNIIYLGAAQGGIWKTTDNGKNWTPKSDNEVSLSVGAIAMDPSNHLILYVGTGEGNFSGDSYEGNGLLRTTNGGDSWTLLAATMFAGARFNRIVINPVTTTTLFAAAGGIFRSQNSGTSWTQMTSGLPAISATVWGATDVVIDPTMTNTVYAAFWGAGIYRTTNASAATPSWTKLTTGLPASGFSRIALAVSPSSPQTVYALMSNNNTTCPNDGSPPYCYAVDKFYISTNSGASWSSIPLPNGPGAGIGGQGFYNLNVAVDPTTPDIVYLSGISLWKAVRNPATGSWTITDIGSNIHADNHAFAFDPSNHLTIYAGNDGGIYKSINAGSTWSDVINEGPCITQFEFIDQHPTSDAVVIGGTQDNGTEQFRNSPVFYHAADGDGGFVAIDPDQPNNVIHEYYGANAELSTHGGKFGTGNPEWGTWDQDISIGLVGDSLFYPPFTLDQTNSKNIAFGTDRINLDSSMGTGGWPTKVILPGVNGLVSAINYVNSNLIYVGTTQGQVYRLAKTGTTWNATGIHAAPLPARWIWDVAVRQGNLDSPIVIMAGFGIKHVWKCTIPASGAVAWTDISGTGSGQLPDIPVNALVIDPGASDTMYIGTDIGVFRTTNGGTTWTQYSQGLPNVAVYDMRLHMPSRLLRAATHGRGMWEKKLDAASMPDVNIFVRDNLMDTGRSIPSPSGVKAAFEDPLQYVALGDYVYWFQCADIKIDALSGVPLAYQMKVAEVDYVAFESKLQHRNPQRGNVNRVYVQIHNRGINPASNVTVKILYADTSAGLPNLPADFWTAFPGNSADTSKWKPIGDAKVIPSLSPVEPAILEWEWATPVTAADYSCMLVVTDCAADPIPAAKKALNIGTLVNNEKHVCLKNLHVVNALPGARHWTPFWFFGDVELPHIIRISPVTARGWTIGLLLPKKTLQKLKLDGISIKKPTPAMISALKEKISGKIELYDLKSLHVLDLPAKGGIISGVSIPKEGLCAMLLFAPQARAVTSGSVSIMQETKKKIIGGSTFILQPIKKK
jgi:photosystem II stability/assembly factor-like uncharacterized protein